MLDLTCHGCEHLQISTLVSRLLNFFNVASATGIPRRLHTRDVSSGWEEPAKTCVLRILSDEFSLYDLITGNKKKKSWAKRLSGPNYVTCVEAITCVSPLAHCEVWRKKLWLLLSAAQSKSCPSTHAKTFQNSVQNPIFVNMGWYLFCDWAPKLPAHCCHLFKLLRV